MNQRRWRRQDYAGGHLPPLARLRPGPPVVVVNLSRSGALVEGLLRPRAGTRCELELSGADGLMRVGARVVRCFVARVEPAEVRYRAALMFETLIVTPIAPDLLAGYQLPSRWTTRTPGGVDGAREARAQCPRVPPHRSEA
jgi:hypothetical protein